MIIPLLLRAENLPAISTALCLAQKVGARFGETSGIAAMPDAGAGSQGKHDKTALH
jgi:hypothetical protein